MNHDFKGANADAFTKVINSWLSQFQKTQKQSLKETKKKNDVSIYA